MSVKQVKEVENKLLEKLIEKTKNDSTTISLLNYYIKKRAQIELEYSLALNKLYYKLFKDHPPDSATQSTLNQLLELTKDLSSAHGKLSNIYQTSLTTTLKDFSKEKNSANTKNIAFAHKYIMELHATYDEFEKAKQAYEKATKEVSVTRKKYDDVLRKGDKKFLSFGKSVDPEEKIEKLRSKWKNSEHKLNDARNQYFLSLKSVQSQQSLYYQHDLNGLVYKLDGKYYDTVYNLFTSILPLELDIRNTITQHIDIIAPSLESIDFTSESKTWKAKHAEFFEENHFEFQNSGGDDTRKIVVDDVTRVVLGQKLVILISKRDAILHGSKDPTTGIISVGLEKKKRELEGLKNLAQAYIETPQYGNASTPLDQLVDLENEVDILGLQLSKLEAQINELENAGVSPTKPVQQYNSHSFSPRTPTISRRPTILPSNTPTHKCIYAYEALDSAELSIRINDQLIFISEPNPGWALVKFGNEEGLVPSNYIEKLSHRSEDERRSFSGSSFSGSTRPLQAVYDYTGNDDGELSFRAGDVIDVIEQGEVAGDSWWDGRNKRTGETGSFCLAFTQGWEVLMPVVTPVSSAPNSRFPSLTGSLLRNSVHSSASSSMVFGKARAIFDYEPSCNGELSLEVNDIITITSKNTGSDSWWQGSSVRGQGQFPVDYVQVLEDDDKSNLSNSHARSNDEYVRALYDYVAQKFDELSFREGDLIRVHSTDDPDWWDGEFQGEEGCFPASYVEKA